MDWVTSFIFIYRDWFAAKLGVVVGEVGQHVNLTSDGEVVAAVTEEITVLVTGADVGRDKFASTPATRISSVRWLLNTKIIQGPTSRLELACCPSQGFLT